MYSTPSRIFEYFDAGCAYLGPADDRVSSRPPCVYFNTAYSTSDLQILTFTFLPYVVPVQCLRGLHEYAHSGIMMAIGNPWLSGALGALALMGPGRG